MTARDSILILNSSFLILHLQFTIQPFGNMDLIVR